MKFFVVSDVHGFYTELMEALNEAGFDKDNPEHFFVSCGDLLDRGREPRKCLQFVNSIPNDRKMLIRGNHEDLLENLLCTCIPRQHDVHNGTAQTIVDLGLTIDSPDKHFNKACHAVLKDPDVIEYLESLVDYGMVNDYVFVHGWIPTNQVDYMENWEKADDDQWMDARWLNGMEMWQRGIKSDKYTVYCGHWHTSWARAHIEKSGSEFEEDADFSIWRAPGIVAMDGCTALTRKVNCDVLEIDGELQ